MSTKREVLGFKGIKRVLKKYGKNYAVQIIQSYSESKLLTVSLQAQLIISVSNCNMYVSCNREMIQDAPEAGCFSWLPMCKLAEVQISIIVTSVNGLKKKGARSLSKYKFERKNLRNSFVPKGV